MSLSDVLTGFIIVTLDDCHLSLESNFTFFTCSRTPDWFYLCPSQRFSLLCHTCTEHKSRALTVEMIIKSLYVQIHRLLRDLFEDSQWSGETHFGKYEQNRFFISTNTFSLGCLTLTQTRYIFVLLSFWLHVSHSKIKLTCTFCLIAETSWWTHRDK